MGELKCKSVFEEICQTFLLGEMVGQPESIPGGLLHRMYALETTKGRFAVKLLNSQIMLRPTAYQNYVNSEKIADLVAKHIPALPSKKVNEEIIKQSNGQFYLVFDWVEGRSLQQEEINEVHCEKIGGILAEIHKTDFSTLKIINEEANKSEIIDWHYYLEKGKESNSEWVELLLDSLIHLHEYNTSAVKASEILASNLVISHRDLDPKNVMWNQDDPLLIDWESAGLINPMHDLIETAIYWSKRDNKIDKQRFFSFLMAYKKRFGEMHADWWLVLENGFLNKLSWLEYNLKRSLGIGIAEEEEQKLGTAQVIGTIYDIRRYARQTPELWRWLNNEL